MEYKNIREYRKAMRDDVKQRRKATEAQAVNTPEPTPAEKKAQKEAARLAAAEKAILLAKEKLEKCGNVMATRQVGLNEVTIYEKGYVEIGGMFIGGIPSKLLGISSNLNTKKKNIVGRGIGSLATGGANLLFTSGNKGMAILTIVSEAGSKVIKVDSPKDSDIKAIVELEAVGEAAIELAATLNNIQSPSTAHKTKDSSLADELAKLAELKKSGALTASEYSAAKKKLLGQ